MKLGEVQVTGTKCNTKSDGSVSWNLYGVCLFDEWEKGCVGMKTVQEWTRLDLSDLRPNDIVRLVYSRGFQGRAQLVDVEKLPKNEA